MVIARGKSRGFIDEMTTSFEKFWDIVDALVSNDEAVRQAQAFLLDKSIVHGPRESAIISRAMQFGWRYNPNSND